MQIDSALEELLALRLPFLAKIGAVRATRGAVPPEDVAHFPPTWSEKRAREHWAGRRAAARALEGYGVVGIVGRDADGVPLFPAPLAGSIAHTGTRSVLGLCVVSDQVRSVGIDVEVRKPLGPELIERIIDPAESALLVAGEAALGDSALWAFCAKEAYYKCVYPTHRRFLGFHEVSFRLAAGPVGPNPLEPSGTTDDGSTTLECSLGEKELGDTVHGRIILTAELVLAIVWQAPDLTR